MVPCCEDPASRVHPLSKNLKFACAETVRVVFFETKPEQPDLVELRQVEPVLVEPEVLEVRCIPIEVVRAGWRL